MDKLEYELLAVKREMLMQRNKLYALAWILNELKPALSEKWREQYQMIDSQNNELKAVEERIKELEKKLGIS